VTFAIIKLLPTNHKNMSEKHKIPETFFDVAEIYSRLDQAIYEHKERLERFGQELSDEDKDTEKFAIDILNEIKVKNPNLNSESEFMKILNEAEKSGAINEKAKRLILSQVY
jgi:predicted site-specific integrase-resolvase